MIVIKNEQLRYCLDRLNRMKCKADGDIIFQIQCINAIWQVIYNYQPESLGSVRREEIQLSQCNEDTESKINELVSKLKPTKPHSVYEDEPICQFCGGILDLTDDNPVCRTCGQVIDWSEW